MLALASIAAAPIQQTAEQSGGNPLIAIGAFLLMLGLLVVIHELGHFLTAVWLGIKVDEFGIGFPPRALTLFERNGVTYTLNWLPLGGFVRFAQNGNGASDPLYGAGGTLAAAPPWRRIIVMVAGPLMNLLLAMLIFAVLFSILGVPTPTGQAISEVFPGTPAEQAGFRPGDELRALDGRSVEDPTVIGKVARDNPGRPVTATVLRDGEEVTLVVVPGPWTSPEGKSFESGFGFSYGPRVEQVQVGPLAATWRGVTYSLELTGRMVQALAGLPASILGLFSPEPSPEGGPIGPVGIARATGEVIQQPGGFAAFWNLAAVLSLKGR